MNFLFFQFNIFCRCCIFFQCKIIVVIQRHLFVVAFTVQTDKGLYNFHFHVRRRKPIITLFLHMHYKFMSKSRNSDAINARKRYLPFNPRKQRSQNPLRKHIVQIFCSNNQNPLLLFVHFVDLHKFDRKDNLF